MKYTRVGQCLNIACKVVTGILMFTQINLMMRSIFFSHTFRTRNPPPSPCGRCFPLHVKRLARWARRLRQSSPAAGPPPSSGTPAASPLRPESLAGLTETSCPAPPVVSPRSWTPGVPLLWPSCWPQDPPLGSSSPAQCSSFPPPGHLTAVWWKWGNIWEGEKHFFPQYL